MALAQRLKRAQVRCRDYNRSWQKPAIFYCRPLIRFATAGWPPSCGDAEELADQGGEGHGKRAPEADAGCAAERRCTASAGGNRTEQSKQDDGEGWHEPDEPGRGANRRREDGNGRTQRKGGGGVEGSLKGTRAQLVGDADFVASVSREGVVFH